MVANVSPSTTDQAADQREFEARLEAHRGIVFKIANTYGRGGEERDDLAQEICLQLWRSYRSYDPERRFSTWMYRVALNTAISFVRTVRSREGRMVSLDESGSGAAAKTAPPTEQDERIERLYRFLHGLAELDRALIVLHLEEHAYREIAEVLGISETNVGTKLSRLKQMMRRQVAPEKETKHGVR